MRTRIDRRHALGVLAGSVGGVSALVRSTRADAQATQSPRQLRLVVPFPPGGPTDAAARIVAEALRSSEGAAVVVENKPGGAGTIGTRFVRDAAPDGYTLVLGNNQTHATAPYLIKDAGYDPVADFTPIAGIGSFPHVLVVRADHPAKHAVELVAAAKTAPGKVTYGSTGSGSGSHLAMELFASVAGVRLLHVPYQGAAQMVADLVAGRIDSASAILPSVSSLIEAGSVRAVAVATPTRLRQWQSIPTLAELGFRDCEAESWIALFGPRGVPAARSSALQRALDEHLFGHTQREQHLQRLGIDVRPKPSDLLAEYQQKEIARWRQVIEAIGLSPG